MAKEMSMICEQGDMGLFCDPISKSEAKLVNNSRDDKKQRENKNNPYSATTKKDKR